MLVNSSIEMLVVEDNPNDIFLLRKAFEKNDLALDFSVTTNGEDALDYLNKRGDYENVKTPDLILLDLNLPKKDGFEVLEEIKSDDQLKSIPVIVFTTSSSEEDIARSYKLSANCYIVKPNNFKEFLKVISLLKSFWLSSVKLPTQV